MTTHSTCSWCHELVTLSPGPTTCPTCGHRADRARLDCDCPACRRAEEERERLDAYREFRDLWRGGGAAE